MLFQGTFCVFRLKRFIIVVGKDMIKVINHTTDIEMIRAVLTYFVRQERFQEGLWAEAVEKKIFLMILLKLKDL